jgi:hypothetical protein
MQIIAKDFVQLDRSAKELWAISSQVQLLATRIKRKWNYVLVFNESIRVYLRFTEYTASGW